MQTLPAAEIKRRGLAALDEVLPNGPVQVIRRNQPDCVVLSLADYERLQQLAAAARPGPDIWSLLLAEEASPGEPRARLDAALAEERAAWE
ncbi:type II toxin-antitoxin system Phd/YefM family antitoxin [Belnapia sp. T6]|uniref:Antitoxin n=1 Tax=Belnapia mucosa TaxID=2804532 RepID=A0ABS1UW64_9PROT|nr:type II toxin-antitoxin system prevent-host-death family antitoxin [Belnapia mucosa]MBL6453718.1 type II toxin-antitoxin system Phd/YefM family antitoxin [Belnapia mucosa]